MRKRTIRNLLVTSLCLVLLVAFGGITLAKDVEWVTIDRIGNPDAKVTLKLSAMPQNTHVAVIPGADTIAQIYEEWARKHPDVQIEFTPMTGDIHVLIYLAP